MAKFSLGDRVRLRGASELGVGVVGKVDGQSAFVCWEHAPGETILGGNYWKIEVVEVAHYAPPGVDVLAITSSVEARLREAAGEDKGANFMLASVQGEARDQMARRADS